MKLTKFIITHDLDLTDVEIERFEKEFMKRLQGPSNNEVIILPPRMTIQAMDVEVPDKRGPLTKVMPNEP